jgi:S-formylglutathione hydrolase FrmB
MSKAVRALLLVVLVAAVCVDTAQPRSAPLRVERALWSPAVKGRLRLGIYLPSGYASSGRRYPVVYFLHGLPAAPTSFRGADFLARALESSGRKAIIVAPQGARDNDSDPEYLDWGSGRNWETAITRDIVGYVDAYFRTIPQRRGRALVGLSAGGYGAVILALHHLAAFSVVESWSGYFHPTDPQGLHALDLGSAQANANASAHAFVKTLRSSVARRPTYFAFYVGRGDERFRDENEQFDKELDAARVPHVFRVYAGGHEQSVWTSHARAWLALAVDHLAHFREQLP